MTEKKIKETIKFIEKLGYKEYTPSSSVEKYDRVWQQIFEKEVAVNFNYWNQKKLRTDFEDGFEVVIYADNDLMAHSIKIYAFKDIEKIYQLVGKYIKFLQRNL